jgi:hypothetical protein
MMTHDEVLTRLDDWAGGELNDLEGAAVRVHLDGCDACRAEAEALRALVAEAAALPREIAPTRELWSGIEARIQPRAASAPVIPLRSRLQAPLRRQPPAWLLAAAAVLLVATTSLVTLRFAGGPAGDGVRPGQGADAASMTAFAAFEPAEREYSRAIEDLRLLLDTRRDALAPETVAVLEENLAIIDAAIQQSRAALQADPSSRELAQMLAAAYDTKIEVLERAVQL